MVMENEALNNVRRHYSTVGPVPFMHLGEATAQLEAQGWTVRFAAFAGMAEVKIAVPGHPPAIPVYALVIVRDVQPGEKPVQPVVKLSGVGNAPGN